MNGVSITPEDVLKARGIAGKLDDMTLEVSPHGGHLVAVAQLNDRGGLINVCWACAEPFDQDGDLRMVEVRPGGGPTPVGLHKKCVDPKARKPFSDMGGSRELSSVTDVSAGLRLRRAVSRVVKAGKVLISG